MQYLQNLSRSQLVQLSTQCKLPTRRTQNIAELVKALLQLHPASKADPEHFKNFPPITEMSGGILCLLCTHGFIYYSKVIMGGEGSSDIADAIRLFSPKVVV